MAAGPSLKSVAAAAGVSVSSVSNAYNKPEQLSASVRERILQVAREQGYAGPDAAARSLRSRRAGAIGVMLTEQLSYAFSDPYTVGLLAGIAEIAERAGTGLLLIPIEPFDSTDASAIERSTVAVRQAVVDGIVSYCVDGDHPALEVIRSRGLAAVTTDARADFDRQVLVDETSTSQIGEHLHALGHRHVGIVTMTDRTRVGKPATPDLDELDLIHFERQRVQGLLDGLGDEAQPLFASTGHNSMAAGHAAAAELLDRTDRPTAIVATSDVMALGVLQALRERDLVAGRDVSVAGFDDVPDAAIEGLTTVRQPTHERGRLLARMLLDPDYPETKVVLPTELVVRSSTGPASH